MIAPGTSRVRSSVEERSDGSRVEYDDIPLAPGSLEWPHEKAIKIHEIEDRSPDEVGTLVALTKELLVDHWEQVMFGPCIEGAVFELALEQRPEKLSLLDGYLTVPLGAGPAHFHLCLAPTRGLGQRTPDDLARIRPCRRAAFARTISAATGGPVSWQIILWNGAGQQVITFFLPSPYLDERQRPAREPDFGKLALWNDLRARYLGETEPQPIPTEETR